MRFDAITPMTLTGGTPPDAARKASTGVPISSAGTPVDRVCYMNERIQASMAGVSTLALPLHPAQFRLFTKEWTPRMVRDDRRKSGPPESPKQVAPRFWPKLDEIL